MNFILGISLLITASLVGIKISNGLKSELIFVQDFERFLSIFETNVNFSRKPVNDVINECESSFKPQFRQVLGMVKTQEFNLDKVSDKLASVTKDFFSNIGFLDVHTQLGNINQTKEALTCLKQGLASNEKLSQLALKLGLMSGVGLFIIVL